MGFKIPGISSNLVKDIFSPKGAVAIGLGQPGYFYEQSKDRKTDAANAAVAAQKAAAVQAQQDAQDATNTSIIDAKRRKRASTLFTGGGLGGASTALGQGGGYAPTAPAMSALGAGG